MKHLELFAGIGGFRRAIDLLGKDFNIPVKCIGFSEIDQYAQKTYAANYDISDEVILGDIVKFTSEELNLKKLPNFDLLTGGFPCQSFSMMGKKQGFSDVRGNVFFHIIDIIKEKQPTFILLENVKNLTTHEKGNTFKVIKESLCDAGYKNIFFDIFNTDKFGLAQKRNRVYIFASLVDLPLTFKFSEESVRESFSSISTKTSLLIQSNVLDVLDKNVENKYYLSETVKPTILADGSKNFKSKSEINQLIARPLTATMVKMHRACQDNYYSDEFLLNKFPLKYLEHTYSKEEEANHKIRKLTPKEALLLQGFDEMFFINARKEGMSDHQLYKQAGNAVSVNTVYAILHHLFITNNLIHYVF